MANDVGTRVRRATVGPLAINAASGDKLFIGLLAERGPANKLVLVSSFNQFEQLFGGPTPRTAGTAYSAGYEVIKDWFSKGGGSAVVLRIVGEAVIATATLVDRAGSPANVFTVTGKGPGAVYNALNAVVSAGTNTDTFKLTITNDAGATLETFDNLKSNDESAQLVTDQSVWINLAYVSANATAVPDNLPAIASTNLAGGTDDNDPTEGEIVGTITGSVRTGLKCFRTKLYRRGFLQLPDLDTQALVIAEMKAIGLPFYRVTFTSSQNGATLDTSKTQRAAWDAVGVGFYFPRKVMIDPYNKQRKTVPVIGQVAADWVRELAQKGSGKPPAGPGFSIVGKLELTAAGAPLIEQEDADQLVAAGINPVWDRDGLGPKVWGAVAATSELPWRQLSAAYLYCVIGDAISTTLDQQVYEVFNDDKFDEVYFGVYAFMAELHRQGSFFGALPSPKAVPDEQLDAFAILVGPNVQTPADNTNKVVRVFIWYKEALSGETFDLTLAKQTA